MAEYEKTLISPAPPKGLIRVVMVHRLHSLLSEN
jgi:hypothetical protein